MAERVRLQRTVRLCQRERQRRLLHHWLRTAQAQRSLQVHAARTSAAALHYKVRQAWDAWRQAFVEQRGLRVAQLRVVRFWSGRAVRRKKKSSTSASF